MIALLVGADIPAELIRAAGFEHRRVRLAELDAELAAGDAACVVFSHLSQTYAQEYHRRHAAGGALPLVMLDLPPAGSPATRAYAERRLRAVAARLGEISGAGFDEPAFARLLAEPAQVPSFAPVGEGEAVVLADAPDPAASLARTVAAGWRLVDVEPEHGYGTGGVVEGAATDPWAAALTRHFTRGATSSRASLVARAAALAAHVVARDATLVVDRTDRDDTSAWLAAALRRIPGTVVHEIGAPVARPRTERPAGAAPRRPSGGEAGRSRKSLESIAGFSAYQREWFADVRARAERGDPFAVVNADAPQEILRALDIPFVVNQWWASIVAAKQATGAFRELLREHGLPGDAEVYNSQGIAAHLADAAGVEAPWGGLPRPDLLGSVRSPDTTTGIFELWSEETGAEVLFVDRTVESRASFPVQWWDDMPDRWEETLEPERLDLMTAQLQESITAIEARTARTLDPERLRQVLDLVNEQEEYYRRTRDLIAATRPAPIGIADSMPATMIPQWHRGTEWGRDAARRFHDEVAERVGAGTGVVADERVRLMWVGRGTWQDMALYQAFERSHGAVFVWSMYLALAADGYLRRIRDDQDPLRSLAARFVTMGDELRMPSWAAAWHVAEAQRHGIDAVVAIADAEPSVLDALERAGLAVLRLGVDNLAGDRMGEAVADIGAFLDERFGRAPGN